MWYLYIHIICTHIDAHTPTKMILKMQNYAVQP